MKRKLIRNNGEIEKLKQTLKEREKVIEEHNMEIDKIKLHHREAENTLKCKLDDIQFQTMDLRCSQDKVALHLQSQNKNYEETILQLKENEIALKSEISQLKSIIKKINSQNSSQNDPKSPPKAASKEAKIHKKPAKIK